MFQPVGNKPSMKRAWSGSFHQVQTFTPHEISSERLKLQTSKFVHGLDTTSTNLQMTNCPLSGRFWKGHVTHSRDASTWRILHCEPKNTPKCFFLISSTKPNRFWQSLAHIFPIKFAITWCKRDPPHINSVLHYVVKRGIRILQINGNETSWVHSYTVEVLYVH